MQLLDKFQGAMVFSAIGDALGWPSELGIYRRHISGFFDWKKKVGGRYFGFEETIRAGSYSDDTQLTLSIARCIDENGNFDADKFAYLELPLWRDYERGGGRSIKTAAESFEKTKRDWMKNFYKKGNLNYRNAGGNGAAMRVLPISLANMDGNNKLLCETFKNAIITHGHPRAILGAIVYSFLINFIIKQTSLQKEIILDYLKELINFSSKPLREYEWFNEWINKWDKNPPGGIKFKENFSNTREEAFNFLNEMVRMLDIQDDRRYYQVTGALSKATRGSGLSTVFVAIYLFLKYINDPQKALNVSVNTIGSDTDTIANFVGGLFGAYYGLNIIPNGLLKQLQDSEYILKLARRLYSIAIGETLKEPLSTIKTDRRDYFLLIDAWKIGLYQMFWDALDEGAILTHPILGKGKIIRKETKQLFRQDYVAKIIEVSFDCGQTCVFHSRVKKELSSILVGEFPRKETPEEKLQKLLSDGLIRGSKGKFDDFTPTKALGKPLSEILREVRGNE